MFFCLSVTRYFRSRLSTKYSKGKTPLNPLSFNRSSTRKITLLASLIASIDCGNAIFAVLEGRLKAPSRWSVRQASLVELILPIKAHESLPTSPSKSLSRRSNDITCATFPEDSQISVKRSNRRTYFSWNILNPAVFNISDWKWKPINVHFNSAVDVRGHHFSQFKHGLDPWVWEE